MKPINRFCAIMATGLLMGAAADSARAITITMDGTNSPTLLSDAVTQAFAADDGPDIINITTDTLATADLAIFINKPITINGDADNNGTPADVLVDMATLKTNANADIGIMGYKSYIEIQTAGDVTINNLNIHPNSDGAYAGSLNSATQNVSGIRIFKPAVASDTLNLNLTKVKVTGSRGGINAIQDLATSDSLFTYGNIKRWGGLNGAQDLNVAVHAAIVFTDDPAGAGSVNATLDHCYAGLSRGCGLVIGGANVNVQVLGGVFGHTARDAVRIAGTATATIKGTLEDRVRIVRSTNVSGDNSHGLEAVGNSIVPLIEYVDIAGVQSANLLNLRDAKVAEVNHVRGLGKFIDSGLLAPFNEPLFITSTSNDVDLIRNSTFYGFYANAMNVQNSVPNPIEFRDNIYAASSTTATAIISAAGMTFNNCALPTDGLAGESLANPAISGTVSPALNNIVSASPQFMLTLADYDWSDDQGASNPLNGAGNRNVLRPALGNAAYATASSTNGRLTGGAGPDPSSVSEWMMY